MSQLTSSRCCFFVFLDLTLRCFRVRTKEIGKQILRKLIARKPKFAEYFAIVTESMEPKDLNSNRQFLLQAHRIQGFLDTAVGALGHCPIDSVYDLARRIGQIHFYRYIYSLSLSRQQSL